MECGTGLRVGGGSAARAPVPVARTTPHCARRSRSRNCGSPVDRGKAGRACTSSAVPAAPGPFNGP